MPLYDYECESCGKEFELIQRMADRKTALCKCGGSGKQVLKRGHGGFSSFKPGWWTDIAREPIYVNNPQELRNALDKNDGRAPYLEDSIWKTSPGPDPIGVRGADPEASKPDKIWDTDPGRFLDE